MNLKDALKGKLSPEEIESLGRSFEVIGDIGIIEPTGSLCMKKHEIAQALVSVQKHVKVVLMKTADVSGTYRLPQYEVIYEDKNRDFSWVPEVFRPKSATETVHREHGCRFRIDPTKAYFSGKMATERGRISGMVRDGENILCLFAGIGPFPVVVAKSKNVNITAIEINPDAVALFRENITLNKLTGKINIIEGDVGKILPQISKSFDRIMMPAPKNAADYLEETLKKAKKGAVIHLYTFLGEEELQSIGKNIAERCKKAGKAVKILHTRKCGNIGPYHYRVVIDFRV